MGTQQQVKETMNGHSSKGTSAAGSIFSQETIEETKDAVNELTEQVKAGAEATIRKSVSLAKKYPLYTAIGAVAIGVLTGLFMRSSKSKKSKE